MLIVVRKMGESLDEETVSFKSSRCQVHNSGKLCYVGIHKCWIGSRRSRHLSRLLPVDACCYEVTAYEKTLIQTLLFERRSRNARRMPLSHKTISKMSEFHYTLFWRTRGNIFDVDDRSPPMVMRPRAPSRLKWRPGQRIHACWDREQKIVFFRKMACKRHRKWTVWRRQSTNINTMTTGVSASIVPCLPSDEAFSDSLILPESRRIIRLHMIFIGSLKLWRNGGNHEPLFDAVKTEMNDFITNTNIIENDIYHHSTFDRRFCQCCLTRCL